MRLANAVYEFLKSEIEQASANSPLEGIELKESLYGDVKAVRTIRIGDAQSEPKIIGDGSIREFEGFLTVQVLVMPEKATQEAAIDAANIAHEAAIEVCRLIANDETLNGNVCDCAVDKKLDGWGNIAARRYAVSYLLLSFHPRNES